VDKNSGRMIGHARERDGLYYIEDSNMSIRSHSLISESTMTNKKTSNFTIVGWDMQK